MGFAKVQRAAGVSPVGTVHDLRDSFIARIKFGVPMDVCARMVGHSSVKTTLKYYTEAAPEDEVRVLEALEGGAQVGGAGGELRPKSRAAGA